MSPRFVDVTLENLRSVPPEPRDSVFWELDEDPAVEAGFEKEEWFSATLLEWGPCGKLLLEEGVAVAFAEFAPGPLFPRLRRFPCGTVSPDAVYLSYCYVVARRRGRGLGTELVREVAGDLLDRGFRALEAVGDREWEAGWVLPTRFLARNGFGVLRDDRRYPLMRLELETAVEPIRATAVAATPLPSPGYT